MYGQEITKKPPQSDDIDDFMSKRQTAPKVKAPAVDDVDSFMESRSSSVAPAPRKGKSTFAPGPRYDHPPDGQHRGYTTNYKDDGPVVRTPEEQARDTRIYNATLRPGEKPKALDGQFKPPVSLDFHGPTDAQKLVDRALPAAQPKPQPKARPRNAFQAPVNRQSILERIQNQQAAQLRNPQAQTVETDPAKLEELGRATSAQQNLQRETRQQLDRANRIQSLRGTPSLDPVSRTGARIAGLFRGASPQEMDEAIPRMADVPVVGQAEDVANRFVGSAVRGAAGVPEGLARFADRQLNRGDLAQARAMEQMLATHPEWSPEEKAATQKQIRDIYANQSAIGDTFEGLTKAGEQAARIVTPTDPNKQGSINPLNPNFYSVTLPEAAGSMAPFMAGGAAGAAAKIPTALTSGILGVGMSVPDQYRKARQLGASPEQLARAVDTGTLAGLIESLGAKSLMGEVAETGRKFIPRVLGEGAKEAGQEALQSGVSDLGAKFNERTQPNLTVKQMLTNAAEQAIPAAFLGGAGGIGSSNVAQRQAEMTRAEQPAPMNLRPTMTGPTQITKLTQSAPAASPVQAPLANESANLQPEGPQTQPLSTATPPSALPLLPAPADFNARRAKLLGMDVPPEIAINEQIQTADKLLNSADPGDQRQGRALMNRALMAIRQSEGYLNEVSQAEGEKPYTAARAAIEGRLSSGTLNKKTPNPIESKPAPVSPSNTTQTASAALRAEADAAKIKAAEFEQMGDFTQAAATYQASHQNLKRLRRSMGQPKTPEAVAQINQIDREISIADANRRKAVQQSKMIARQANAPTAGLPESKKLRQVENQNAKVHLAQPVESKQLSPNFDEIVADVDSDIDTGTLAEVRQFQRRKPQTETFTEEPPTGQLARRPAELPEVTAMREREKLPPMERQRALREATPKGQFGQFSSASRAGATTDSSLAGNAQLRRLLGLGQMPPYHLPDAPINPKTGKPYVNPAWQEASQETLNELARLAGKERSSQINFLPGENNSRGEMGDVYAKLTQMARRKGERISPELRAAFAETAIPKARAQQEAYERFISDERTEDFRTELTNTFAEGNQPAKALREAFIRHAEELGLSRSQAGTLYSETANEAKAHAERGGAKPPTGGKPAAPLARSGSDDRQRREGLRATGTEGKSAARVKPADSLEQIENDLSWGAITEAHARKRKAALGIQQRHGGPNLQAAFQAFRDRKKEAKPERAIPLPKDFNVEKWARKTYADAMVNALPTKDRAEYDKAATEREKNAILMAAKVDQNVEASVFKLIDKVADAAEKNDGRAVMEAVRDAKEFTAGPATNWEKASALRKAAMLSRPTTHFRNIIGNTAFQPVEELSRFPGSIADSVVGLVTGRRAYLGPNVGDMMRASHEALTTGVQRAKDALKGLDIDKLEDALQTKEAKFKTKIVDKAVKAVFRSLGAEDQIFFTYAYDRALREQAKLTARNEAKAGVIARKDISDRADHLRENPTEQMDVDAMIAAEVAVFRNSNKLSSALGMARQSLGDKGSFAVDLFLPFDKTPTNIIARTLEYTPVGGVIAAGKGLAATGRAVKGFRAEKKEGAPTKQAIKAAIDKAMTPAQQRSFAQLVGRSVTGTAPIALGYALAAAGIATGFYDEEDRKGNAQNKETGAKPSSIKIGGRWYQIGGVPPLGNLIALGATLHKQVGDDMDAEDATVGTAKGVMQVATDVPLLKSSKDLLEAIQKPERSGQMAGRMAGSFIPGILGDLGQSIPGVRDSVERDTRAGKGVKGFNKFGREAASEVISRIPGVRKYLPEKKTGLGKPVQTEWHDVLDPFNSRPAEELGGDYRSERLKQGKLPTDVLQKKGEPEAIFTQRKARVEGWMSKYGDKLIASPRYTMLTEAEKKAAIELLRDRIGRQQNLVKPRMALLEPNAVLLGVRKSAAEKPKRRAKNLWSAP